MPKIEAKLIRLELEKNTLWPVYWLYGRESMKSRELLSRIRGALQKNATGLWGEENLDGNEVEAAQVLDLAQNLMLGGGTRLLVIRNAEQLKNPETLESLLGPKGVPSSLVSVCVFIAKDLDGRKKFTKKLLEKAAVVPCEEVPDAERESWILYLAKRRELSLKPEEMLFLRCLDPWSLDCVDQELEKRFLLGQEINSPENSKPLGTEDFIEAFFKRDLKNSLASLKSFADAPDQSIPLLGLLAWNIRHLIAPGNLNPYLKERFRRWQPHWKKEDLLELQHAFYDLDFGLKQTGRLSLGLWSTLVQRFCASERKAPSPRSFN